MSLLSCDEPLALEEVPNVFDLEELEAKSNIPCTSKDIVNSWKPYWMFLRQPKSTPFFQANIGIGFLYFSGIMGNFTPIPPNIGNICGGEEPYRGRLSYNRTPLFEYLLGYRFTDWLKFALSYQTQNGISIQTKPVKGTAFNPSVPGNAIVHVFKANLGLNSLMLKGYFEYPIPMIWKRIGYSPYVGVGFGPGWQSWTNLQITRTQSSSFSTTAVSVEQSLRQKTCANFAWMFDLGFRLRSTSKEGHFFTVMGLKYTQWGQARNLGKLSQQGTNKIGFLHPFRIKTLYSFSPYLGVQWTFPNTLASRSPRRLHGESLKSWIPFFTSVYCLGDIKSVWTEFNVGVGFLYFDQVKGSLSSRPRDPLNNLASNVPITRGGISYNRTPLLEFMTGFRIKPWLRVCGSYQHQSDVSVSTSVQHYEDLNTGNNLQNSTTYAQFKGNLILDSILIKGIVELPYAVVFRSIATSPYAAVGLGPGWQTWTQLNVWRYTNTPTGTLTSAAQPLRSKICANAVFLADIGVRMKSVSPKVGLSVLGGVKYNLWGQARNLGKIDQQGYRSYGLFPPLKIKTIYSFSPYLGVLWNFPIYNKTSPKKLVRGRSPNTWKPFLASLKDVENKQGLSLEYSLGMGFLYFHKISGFLAQIPSAQSAGYSGIPPMDRELSYNRTPLYEFILGYRYLRCLKAALSYQTQRNVSIATKYYRPSLASEIDNAVHFTANLQLESVMAKVYFELPKVLILKNLATTFYGSVGMGPSWQSWTQMEYQLVSVGAKRAQYYKQKICANVGLMADFGFRVQSVSSDGAFSVTKGIKYTQWGQARNLGKITQQGALGTGLFKSIRIKVIYSFAPYLGVQWNF